MIKCGVIGVGYLGRFHAQKYKILSEQAELVGVSDMSEPRGTEVAKELGVPFIADYRDLLSRVQTVTIAASTMAHFEVAREALNRGIHVFVEKPITDVSPRAEELVKLADQKKLCLQVGHIERFNPTFREAVKHVNKPLLIEASRLSVFTPRGADVSVVHDLMIHDLDLVLNLSSGSPVKSVEAMGISAVTSGIDFASAHIQFESGCVANVTASRMNPIISREMRVHQKNKVIGVDFGKFTVSLTTPQAESTPRALQFNTEFIAVEKGDALLAETRSFLECVRTGQKPEVTGRDATEALKLAESIVEKIKARLH